MTTETMLDRRLRELMAELAAPGDQSAAIDNVISVTRALRPEPRWRALLKERPMRTNSIVIAGSPPLRFGLIFAVIALIGLLAATVVVGALVLRQPARATRLRAGRQRRPCLCRFRRHRDHRRRRGQPHRPSRQDRPWTVGRCSRATAPGSRSCARRPGRRSSWWPTPTERKSKPYRLPCTTTSTQSTGPRTVERLVVLGDLLLDPRQTMSILVLAADGTGSREPIELGDISPNGWAAWRPPAGDEIIFRANPTRR